MPLIGSTAYNTLGSVNSLMRSLLNDAAGNWATDTLLTPYANSAYRTLQRRVANAGGGGFIQEDFGAIIKAVAANLQDPGTQVVWNDATPAPNQLPSDLIVPLRIRERPNGSNADYSDLVNLSQHGGLPSRLQGATLDVWEWRADGVYFIGATQDTQVDLRYQRAYPDLVGPTDVILVRGAQEAIAYAGVGLTGLARGSPLADKIDQLAEDAIESVILENVRVNQVSPTRRRAYGARSNIRRGGRPWDLL